MHSEACEHHQHPQTTPKQRNPRADAAVEAMPASRERDAAPQQIGAEGFAHQARSPQR